MNTCSMLASTGPRGGWGHMGNGAWSGWMLGWGLLILFFTLAAAAMAITLITKPRGAQAGTTASQTGRTGHARELLADRYARGEIDTAEYQERLSALAGTSRGVDAGRQTQTRPPRDDQ